MKKIINAVKDFILGCPTAKKPSFGSAFADPEQGKFAEVREKRIIGYRRYFNLDVLELSKYIINKCNLDNCPISNLQLNRVLYALKAEFLLFDQILFYEQFEPKIWGPQLTKVYHHFCANGSINITFNYDIDEEKLFANFDKLDKDFLDSAIEHYRILKPWDWNKYLIGCYKVFNEKFKFVPDEYMKKSFKYEI